MCTSTLDLLYLHFSASRCSPLCHPASAQHLLCLLAYLHFLHTALLCLLPVALSSPVWRRPLLLSTTVLPTRSVDTTLASSQSLSALFLRTYPRLSSSSECSYHYHRSSCLFEVCSFHPANAIPLLLSQRPLLCALRTAITPLLHFLAYEGSRFMPPSFFCLTSSLSPLRMRHIRCRTARPLCAPPPPRVDLTTWRREPSQQSSRMGHWAHGVLAQQ